mmetsp:Transcript_8127/g.18711  ORF Transcript_8127/g.18711 Transcript_8127/m.18711 type:complete len:336 (-) Transcript_8127:130-1137(-)
MDAPVGKHILWAAATGGALAVGVWVWWQRRQQGQRWQGWGTSKYASWPIWSQTSQKIAEETKLRPSDVVVITFPKTGTTWLQQTCEQLRTGGDMAFSEITERQPWLDIAWDCGQDLSLDQVASPRLFKSHQKLSAINIGAKYLSIIRKPEGVLMSWFAFQKGKGRPVFIECADSNEYAATELFAGRNIFGTDVWDYYVELWEARNDANVLVLCYEALMADQLAYLPVIAEFLDVPVDEVRLQKVVEMTTKEFMTAHDDQFDDNFILRKSKELGRTPKVFEAGVKVTQGPKDRLTLATKTWLQVKWLEKVAPRTGLMSYEEMADAIAASSRSGMKT